MPHSHPGNYKKGSQLLNKNFRISIIFDKPSIFHHVFIRGFHLLVFCDIGVKVYIGQNTLDIFLLFVSTEEKIKPVNENPVCTLRLPQTNKKQRSRRFDCFSPSDFLNTQPPFDAHALTF